MTRLEGVAHEVTGLLRAWRAGDAAAGEELLQRIYIELKKIAVSQLRRERSGHTLQSTDLVHEAYVRLLEQQGIDWRDRAHFFGLAATMMRRVLVDHARARNARKRARDEGEKPITLQSRQGPEVELLDLDRSLTLFAERYPRQTQASSRCATSSTWRSRRSRAASRSPPPPSSATGSSPAPGCAPGSPEASPAAPETAG